MAPADDADLPDSLRALYREDATILAIRRVHELVDFGAAPAAEPVRVPPALVQFFYDGIVHVYNARALPQRDSVFALLPAYQVHARPDPYPYWFTVTVLRSEPWAQAWEAGLPASGNAAADSLVALFGLDVSVSSQSAATTVFRLTTEEPLNLRPIMWAFRAFTGVQSVTGPAFIGSGRSDVTAAVEAPGVGYRFRLGWGDCPAGCVHHRTWSFLVGYAGGVAAGGSVGGREPVPAAFYGP